VCGTLEASEGKVWTEYWGKREAVFWNNDKGVQIKSILSFFIKKVSKNTSEAPQKKYHRVFFLFLCSHFAS